MNRINWRAAWRMYRSGETLDEVAAHCNSSRSTLYRGFIARYGEQYRSISRGRWGRPIVRDWQRGWADFKARRKTLKEVAASLDCSTTAVRHHFLILYGAEYEALTRGGGRQPGPVETVRQLYAEGNTPAEIAHKLGYATANPIHIMLRGTPEKRAKKAAQEEKFDNFERLHSKGFSPAEIADILNVSRHSVAIWLRRHGYVANRPRLQGRRPKHSDLPGWKLRHWRLQQGLTQAQVQEKTGITNWSAYECGRKPITQSMAMRLQKLLDG